MKHNVTNKILMVEDSQLQAKKLTDLLTGQGMAVDHAKTGALALELATKNEYDLILLDMILPDTTGLQLFSHLKNIANITGVPVIIISGATDKENVVDALVSGVNDYITKPYHDQEVITRVNLQLTIRINAKNLIRINEERARFFAILAHDIKNPFQGILGFSELLLNEPTRYSEAEKLKYIGFIHDSTKSLHTLLETILSWSALQSGNMVPKPERFDIVTVLNEILLMYEPHAKAKQIQLTCTAKSQQVKTDQNMLSTVMRNLLSNAIKFTPANGQVSISARINEGLFEIAVRDSGIGIRSEEMANLFSLDQTRLKTGTGGEQGTGIGLAFCRDFIEALGGWVKVKSQPGEGAEFTVVIPIA